MLDAITPIDGRYRKMAEPLAKYCSERAFIEYRVRMEEAYLRALARTLKLQKLQKLQTLHVDANEIKKIEQTTNHDFKAIEYWMKRSLKTEWVHFGLTSQDATNIAQALMITDALREVIIPALESVQERLIVLVQQNAALPMLARTHGQPASPTTFGKEIAVFTHRLKRQLSQLKTWRATAKLNGATGNYNALVAAFPRIDWIVFSKKFITSLGLEPNLITTQIEPYDNQAELFDCLRRINMILIDFCQDTWRYISDGWLKQKAVAGEVGSSTMPHKINPIRLENSEGNLGIANALFSFFSQKLPVSRLQRDLSDSTVQRSIGTALAHALIGYQSLLDGLARIDKNEDAIRAALAAHPEVLAEAIQTILRREGVLMPYEKLKALTRGREITLEDLRAFVSNLSVDAKVRKELLALTPETYTGLAETLATWQN